MSPGRGVAVSTTKPTFACAHTYELAQHTQTHTDSTPHSQRANAPTLHSALRMATCEHTPSRRVSSRFARQSKPNHLHEPP